ncbi:amidohydrolase family protein [Cohnella suwonensis]|uniref:Amidohydrolase family protein n=1 Tax=Cohnella suwonensis TaxID=696072 RepID=A0ABW0LZY3_9BACL
MTTRKIDSHVHVFNVERVSYGWPTPADKDLYRVIEPPELQPLLDEAGIGGTVLVQAADHSAETDYLLEIAEAHESVLGVVGWVPLAEPLEAGRRLEKLARRRYFKGVRHLIHGEADPDWLVRADVLEGLRTLASFGLPFDVVAVYPNHLRHIPRVAESVPNLRLALDHLAKPPISGGPSTDAGSMAGWEAELAAAAAYPNVYAKLSGLNTACDWNRWTPEDWKPSVDAAFRSFGADRLLFGSDWPVANLAGDYRRVWEATLSALESRSPEDKSSVLGGTAERFYRLD